MRFKVVLAAVAVAGFLALGTSPAKASIDGLENITIKGSGYDPIQVTLTSNPLTHTLGLSISDLASDVFTAAAPGTSKGKEPRFVLKISADADTLDWTWKYIGAHGKKTKLSMDMDNVDWTKAVFNLTPGSGPGSHMNYSVSASTGGTSAVPVPGAVWLLGSGLLGLVGLRRTMHV